MTRVRDMLSWLRSRLTDRPDSEHGQAIVRLIIAVLLIGYLLTVDIADHAPERFGALEIMTVEALIGLGLIIGILVSPGVSHVRRAIGMAADYATLALLMRIDPISLAPLYIIILWVTVGNGIRYGNRYLIAAACVALAAYLLAIQGVPYWQSQPHLTIGLAVGLIAIPAYLRSLLEDLHRTTQEARRANAAKSRFLAVMSHELRSPLNGIIGMAHLMRNSRLTAEQQEYADVIQTSAQTLSLLVDEVLDISAIEAGKLHRKEADFNLRELTGTIGKMLQPQASGKNIALEIRISPETPLDLYGDSAHLIQILLNLLGNAIKFTETGSVTLEIARVDFPRRAEPRLAFSVRDTGIGIPDEYKARIFDAFEQVDTGPARKYGGTGLGTTIARTLTQLLGGTIRLEDNPGGGSHFLVEIPFRVSDAPGSVADDSNVIAFDDPFIRHKARVKSLNVLIADDQAANRAVLSKVLEHAGHRSVMASDGEQALELMEKQQFDLAILDMHMPEVSGLDVMRHLRFMQAGYEHKTPVIVISADATEQARADAAAAGAQLYLSKPIVVPKLLESIAEVFARQGASAPSAVTTEPTSNNPMVLRELAAMGLSDEFLTDFVEQCLSDLANCQRELLRHGESRDWAEFRDTAHAMKGVGENLGAYMISDRCRLIMRSDDTTLSRKHRAWTGEIEGRLAMLAEQVHREVAAIITEHQSGTTSHTDDSPRRQPPSE